MRFTQTEKENPMLIDGNWDEQRNIDDGAKICPICGGGKFKDNDICYNCKNTIRSEFIKYVWQYMSKNTQNSMTIYKLKDLPLYRGFLVSWSVIDKEYVNSEVEDLLDIL